MFSLSFSNFFKCKSIQQQSGNQVVEDLRKGINPTQECVNLDYCENSTVLSMNSKASSSRAKLS